LREGIEVTTDANVTYRIEGIDASQFSVDIERVITLHILSDTATPQDSNQDNVYEITIVASNTLKSNKQRIVKE